MHKLGGAAELRLLERHATFHSKSPWEAQPGGLRPWTRWLKYLLGPLFVAVEQGNWAPLCQGWPQVVGMLESAGMLCSFQTAWETGTCLLL